MQDCTCLPLGQAAESSARGISARLSPGFIRVARPPADEPAPSARGKTNRDPRLDGLRGLAMSLVFLVHFGGVSAHSFGEGSPVGNLLASLSAGQFGSTIFLLIAGYTLYGRVREQQEFDWRPYLLARALRILPLYWVTLGLYIAVKICLNQHDKLPADAWGATAYVVQNALLVAPFLGTPTMVAVAWTLSYLFLGYLIVPAIGVAFTRYALGTAPRVGLIVAFAALWVIAPGIWSGLAANGIGLAYGMLFYEANRSWRFHRMPGGLVDLAAFAALAASIWLFSAFRGGLVVLSGPSGHLVRVAATAIPVCLLFAGRLTRSGWLNRFLAGKAGRWLGQVSYSYYLFHGLVVIAARTTLCHPGFRESVPAPLVLAAGLPLCYAASLAVAAAMHYGLELPLRRMLPGRPGRRAPRLLAPAIPPLSRAAAAGGG